MLSWGMNSLSPFQEQRQKRVSAFALRMPDRSALKKDLTKWCGTFRRGIRDAWVRIRPSEPCGANGSFSEITLLIFQ